VKKAKKKPEVKYRIRHFDPTRWVYEYMEEYRLSKKEAKKRASELLKLYPLSSQGYLRIEKVEFIFVITGLGDKG